METGERKIQRTARLNLLYAQNCAHATLLSLEDVFGYRYPVLLRAATNFEGGLVGCGETCGVVTGGVLGIGALASSGGHDDRDRREEAVQRLSREYKTWFESRFGTSVCRERTQVDFSTMGGLVRYLLPGDKLVKCLHHIGQAVGFLSRHIRKEIPGAASEGGRSSADADGPLEPHCCYTVLRRIGQAGLESDPALVWATAGLAGGVAQSGSVCGALLGAVLSLGLEFGYDPRSMGVGGITAAFIRGHWNLLRKPGTEIPREAFARSRALADHFRKRFGSLRCRDITGRSFSRPQDVRIFLGESRNCQAVLSWCEAEAGALARM